MERWFLFWVVVGIGIIWVGVGIGKSLSRRGISYFEVEDIFYSLLDKKLQPRSLASLGREQREYRVKYGDSLWQIASTFFHSPWYWPYLWAMNEQLSNPHRLEVGQLLKLGSLAVRGVGWKRGEDQWKLQRGLASSFLGREIEVCCRVEVYHRPYYFILHEEDYRGRIVGAYKESHLFQEFDLLFSRIIDSSVQVGDIYYVVKRLRSIGQGGRKLGDLVRLVGKVKVDQIEGGLFRLVVLGAYYQLERGDWLVREDRVREFFTRVGMSRNNNEEEQGPISSRVIAGEGDGKSFLGEGDIVILRGGWDRFVVGDRLGVVIDSDGLTQERGEVLLHFKAEVEVIFVASEYSLGIIKSSKGPVQVGDRLLPISSFKKADQSKVSSRVMTYLE